MAEGKGGCLEGCLSHAEKGTGLQGAASGKGEWAWSSQLLWETTTSMALLTNCAALLFYFFPSSLFLQFIFLTRSMMLLQTENNRDGVSAKAISELNQS